MECRQKPMVGWDRSMMEKLRFRSRAEHIPSCECRVDGAFATKPDQPRGVKLVLGKSTFVPASANKVRPEKKGWNRQFIAEWQHGSMMACSPPYLNSALSKVQENAPGQVNLPTAAKGCTKRCTTALYHLQVPTLTTQPQPTTTSLTFAPPPKGLGPGDEI